MVCSLSTGDLKFFAAEEPKELRRVSGVVLQPALRQKLKERTGGEEEEKIRDHEPFGKLEGGKKSVKTLYTFMSYTLNFPQFPNHCVILLYEELCQSAWTTTTVLCRQPP